MREAAAFQPQVVGEELPPVVDEEAEMKPVVRDEHEKLGRNEPCWCGSGKKFKRCHGAAA